MAGVPSAPSPLHWHSDRIVIAEQMDYHLVWAPGEVFIKPLPRFLLDPDFWSEHLCYSRELFGSAIGFLLSYTSLIRYESDYRIAKEKYLLPEEVSWQDWVVLVEQILSNSSGYLAVTNKRYIYGVLSLERLNWIYRLIKQNWIQGYLIRRSGTFGGSLKDYFNYYLVVWAFITIALGAMQVGLATKNLQDNKRFVNSSARFASLCVLAPAVVTGSILVRWCLIVLISMLGQLAYLRRRGTAAALP